MKGHARSNSIFVCIIEISSFEFTAAPPRCTITVRM